VVWQGSAGDRRPYADRDGMVLEWRVFADNKPVYEILAKRDRAGA
jgi:hypothetical protein